ncbi:hypothetical protein [Chitinophaga silvisoli]|uniref:Uncharacterized protein n=1 Tax=Chitinophaga silvisoli TaxID=2291814 RepID=A0A3E1NV73_9BACT|nr:hypothetical protein [Chitinophaga silvisoli]RFM31819.1 hypothetical protein DXN04_27040 [Chitinophaga silvisoli]
MNDLLTSWNSVNTTSSIHAGLLQERHHPVLKQIRKQMLIELAGFVLFLAAYYDFFDGAQKPIYANVVLIIAMLAVIAGNVTGYILAKQQLPGDNIREALKIHLKKLRLYACVAILARALMMTGVVVFFKANTMVIALFTLMLLALVWLWVRRIKSIQHVCNDFLNPVDLGSNP